MDYIQSKQDIIFFTTVEDSTRAGIWEEKLSSNSYPFWNTARMSLQYCRSYSIVYIFSFDLVLFYFILFFPFLFLFLLVLFNVVMKWLPRSAIAFFFFFLSTIYYMVRVGRPW